ncbi:winged helix-turn-helix transcriptional regulator [bacterium]|nr:winged helix-turn-helix transcriptional regulator [bacterium]
MKEDLVMKIGHSLHVFLEAIGIDRLGKWSDALDGISPMDLHIIRMTAENPDVILKDIRDDLEIPQSTLTSTVDRLEGRGLIERIISRRDRRSYGLKLTAKGRKTHSEHERIDREGAALILEALGSEREAKRFIKMLSKICRKFDQAYEEMSK